MTKVQRRLRQLSALIRDRIASSLQLAPMEATGRSRKTKSVHPELCPFLQHTRHFKLLIASPPLQVAPIRLGHPRLSMIFMAHAMKVGSDTSAARPKLCPKTVNGNGAPERSAFGCGGSCSNTQFQLNTDDFIDDKGVRRLLLRPSQSLLRFYRGT